MSEKIKAKIVKALNVKPGNGETPESYTARVIKKAAKLKNEEWDSLLDNPEQVWINEQITRGNNIKDAKEAGEEYNGPQVDLLTPPTAPEDQDESGEPAGEPESSEGVEAVSDEADEASEDDDETQEEQEAEVLQTSESSKSKKASSSSKGKSTKKAAAKTAKKKEAAPPKAKKATAKKKGGESRGRKAMFSPDQHIKLKVKENPHREGTGRWKRWPKYRNNMTVRDALEAGFKMDNLRFSVQDEHIDIV